MKQALYITFLLFTALHGEDAFIITNQHANEERVATFTTSDGEFETLFEIVNLEEPALPIQNELITTNEIAENMLILPESLERETVSEIAQLAPLKEIKEIPFQKETKQELIKAATPEIKINFKEVFTGSPIIYSLLLTLSIGALFIGFYNQFHLRQLVTTPDHITKTLRNRLTSNQFEEAASFCIQNDNLFCKMLGSGISMRKYGRQTMLETMKTEGKRATVKFWQKLSLLNDIAIIAPMVGLLGTVLGMFYAFYDINRSTESLSALFNGLGISVGTTLAGLIVAIFSLILHSLIKYRLVKRLTAVENEVHSFSHLIDNKM